MPDEQPRRRHPGLALVSAPTRPVRLIAVLMPSSNEPDHPTMHRLRECQAPTTRAPSSAPPAAALQQASRNIESSPYA